MGEKRNIRYISEQDADYNPDRHTLDIYYPEERVAFTDVLVFIHGGTWISGSKDMYQALGPVLRDKGLVAVIINYRLSYVNYQFMAIDCASAVKWVHDHIDEFGGSPERIWVCGHSAGGHLAALITLDPEYFINLAMENPVKGCILLDAFGLNIGHFIKEHGTDYMGQIGKVFTADPASWEKASPINFVSDREAPFLVFTGSRTYHFVTLDNEFFVKKLLEYHRQVHFEVIPGKSHIEMVTQLRDPDNPLYKKILHFIKEGLFESDKNT